MTSQYPRILIRANIGCAHTPTEGWMNFDNSMSVRCCRSLLIIAVLKTLGLASENSIKLGVIARDKGIRWANACQRLPVPDESLDAAYSSHMLEHLDFGEVERFLAEIHRVLIPGGIVRLAVPDLKRRIEKYVESADADEFMRSLNIREQNLDSWRGKLRMLIIGDRGHRWMYDSRSLIRRLETSGFVNATEMPPGKTMIPDPGALDLREREDDSVYVEATKA